MTIASELAKRLQGRRSGSGYICRCPAHDDGEPSLSVGEGSNGQLLVKCFAGCSFRSIMKAIDEIGNSPNHVSRLPAAKSIPEKARLIWNEAKPITAGDAVDTYLRKRCIALDRFPESLRFHMELDYWEQDASGKVVSLGKFPAMIARVTDEQGNLQAVHRTYLTGTGEKANVPTKRKLLGSASGGAIKLCPAGDVLALSEGIETGLAYHALTQLPVWSCVSSTNLGKALVPDSVKIVYIAVDLDESGAGEKASQALANRLSKQGKTVLMARPPVSAVGLDWNDYLKESKYECCQEELYQC